MSTAVTELSSVPPAIVAAATPEPTTTRPQGVLALPLRALKLSATNPRSEFDEEALTELAASIASHGILQALVVRPMGDRYEIIAGARRYKAAKLAKLSEVPCRIIAASDEEAGDIQIIENLQRADIHPLDEAEAYAKLCGKCGEISQVAQRVAKAEAYVRRRLQLNSLTKELKAAYRQRKLVPAHAYQLCRFPAAQQKEIAKQIEGRDCHAEPAPENDRRTAHAEAGRRAVQNHGRRAAAGSR